MTKRVDTEAPCHKQRFVWLGLATTELCVCTSICLCTSLQKSDHGGMLMAFVFPCRYRMYSARLAMNAYVGQAVPCMISALKHSAYGIQDMQRRGQWGHIIHISSMAAHRVPSFSDAFYSATKHALKALAEGLRQEVRYTHLANLPTLISDSCWCAWIESHSCASHSHSG